VSDYSRGALDALTWVVRLCRLCHRKSECVKRGGCIYKFCFDAEPYREIKGAYDRLQAGVALDFSEKLKLLPKD